MENRIKLISLSSNIEMTEEMAKILGIEAYPHSLVQFADGEVIFEGKESVRGCNVYIVQSTCTPVNDKLMELLLCVDACKRASAKSITCIIPYFGYSRQDRKAKARQPISAKLVADLITTAGADRVVCTDLHASQIQGFFNIPVDDVSALPVFYNYFSHLGLENITCVSPDHGGVVRTSKLAEKLNAPIAIIDKRRPEPNKAEIVGIVGDIKDRDCIIIDDICDTGGTLCLAANKIKELGAKHVYVAISHGIFSRDAIEKINASAIDKIIITDSIPLPENKKSDKIEVVTLAPLFALLVDGLEKGLPQSDIQQKYADSMYKATK